MLFFDVNYWVYMIPAFLVMLAAQYYVSSSYKKWSQVPNRSRITGAEAAQRLIRSGGLYDVRVEGVSGKMSDHYDPRKKVLRLSQGVYQTSSVAAVAIAAHELGHAMQDQEGYLPLRLRSAMIPAVNIGG
jgi:Zn-dependent membrane protease YugP